MKKYISLILMITLLTCFAACGAQEETAKLPDSEGEYVFVPEFITLAWPETLNDTESRLGGDKLYQFNYLYDLDAMTATEQFQVLSLNGEMLYEIALGGNGEGEPYYHEYLCGYDVDAQGNVYTVELGREQDGKSDYYLCCYDDSGSKVFARDITAAIKEDERSANASQLLLDEAGRIYVRCQESVKLFEQDGSLAGSIPMAQIGYIYALANGRSGDAYVFYQDSFDLSARGAKIEFEAGELGEAFGNLPGRPGDGDFCPGENGDFYINVGSKVYDYDIESQSYEEVLTWLNCDIVGSNVSRIERTEDGALFAVVENWAAGTMEAVFLNRRSASEVEPKTEIVLGMLYEDREIQTAVVDFNKKNDEYRVVLRTYVDSDAGEGYEDGIRKLNLDIVSGNSPDIFDLSRLDIETLTLGGAVEDLTPYLESSSVIDKEDYLENILAGYTYGGKLAAIPHSFNIRTWAGKTSGLGEEMGWTLEEMLAYAEEHSQSKLIYNGTKSSVMEFCMNSNMELFIDWESGETKFDSELFVRLLEFVNTYPDVLRPQENAPKTEELLRSDEVLLFPVSISYFYKIQDYPYYFDEPVTYIGYPTADGSAAAVLGYDTDQLYGISAASGNKDGAWAFIESCLNLPVEVGFSPRRSQLELQIEKSMDYMRDANGEPKLDENGNLIPAYGSMGFGFGKYHYTYHISTNEEIGWVMDILLAAKPMKGSDSQVMAMIEEEAQAFYAGQRTAEDVAEVIQSRVQTYVDERR